MSTSDKGTGREADQEPPKITFPCDYPIKVIGNADPDFKDYVVRVMHKHAPGFDETKIDVNASRNGRFISVRLIITATGEAQLQTLFEELKGSGRVHMVL